MKVVQPLLEVCGVVVPVLLAVVGALGAIWCIVLGVKYAQATDPQERHYRFRTYLCSFDRITSWFERILRLVGKLCILRKSNR